MSEPLISVLLVDDHALVRRGFRRMLEDDPAITVIGEAEDGHQAVQLAAELRPRVVVMDFAMPSMNGAVAARHILRTAPDTAVLILSMHAEASYVRTCLEAGVRGYLLKNAMDLEMVAAVKQVAAGKQVLDQRLGSLEQPAGPHVRLPLDPALRRIGAGAEVTAATAQSERSDHGARPRAGRQHLRHGEASAGQSVRSDVMGRIR